VTPVTFIGDQYDVSSGGIVPVPADEFVISFTTSGSETYMYLLAGDDVMTSDMIYIEVSSYRPYAGMCTNYTSSSAVGLPYKRGRISRGCYTPYSYYDYNVSTHSHFKF
jgi:hypothetical protein